jgi:hypothetical protein
MAFSEEIFVFDRDIVDYRGDNFLRDIPLIPVKELGDVAAKNMIIALGRGTLLPLRISIGGNLFRAEGTNNLRLRLLQSIFIKFTEEGVMISTDRQNWGTFEELIEIGMDAKFELDKTNRPSIKIIGNARLKD